MLKGRIFDVQRFSLHDGPGIRTTVFLKGCSLVCKWCHNPEGLSHQPSIRFSKEKCVSCGACGYEKTQQAAAKCLTGALTMVGMEVTPEELLPQLLRDRDFYGASGGVTISGGEALCQAEFVFQLLTLLKANGINTAIDTAGCVPWESMQKTLPLCDRYLYDVKCIDAQKHKQFTGQDNALILSNFRRLGKEGANIWVRVPVIPSFNDSLLEMERISQTVSEVPGVEQVTLMPYHTLGKSKYQELGLTPLYETDQRITPETIKKLSAPFISKGLNVR